MVQTLFYLHTLFPQFQKSERPPELDEATNGSHWQKGSRNGVAITSLLTAFVRRARVHRSGRLWAAPSICCRRSLAWRLTARCADVSSASAASSAQSRPPRRSSWPPSREGHHFTARWYSRVLLIRGGGRSGRRTADQPHRTGQAHARTVRIRRQGLAEGGDGGRDDLCRLVAQPTVYGADFG
jgi:hypothetical protein